MTFLWIAAVSITAHSALSETAAKVSQMVIAKPEPKLEWSSNAINRNNYLVLMAAQINCNGHIDNASRRIRGNILWSIGVHSHKTICQMMGDDTGRAQSERKSNMRCFETWWKETEKERLRWWVSRMADSRVVRTRMGFEIVLITLKCTRIWNCFFST